MKPLIIGETPGGPPGSEVTGALESPSGRTLARLASIEWEEFLETFERANVFEDRRVGWSRREAAVRAELMLPRFAGRDVILLGALVAHAFGVERWPLFEWRALAGGMCVRVPHPSGLNRSLNDASTRALLGATVRAAAGLS